MRMKLSVYRSMIITMAVLLLACTDGRYESCREAAEQYCLWVIQNNGMPWARVMEKFGGGEDVLKTCTARNAYACVAGSKAE